MSAPDYPELDTARTGFRLDLASDCLANRVIVVTGAGAGIGAALAKTCAVYGATLVLIGRTRSRLDGIYDWIGEHTGREAAIVPADLAALTDVSADALRDAVADSFGRCDALVNNASTLGPLVPVQSIDPSTWRQQMDANVTAPFLLTRSLMPMLMSAPDASIVNLSSSVGRKGRAYWGGYAVSKFALEGLTEVLADELEQTNVRCNSVNPGGTRTAMRAKAYPAEDPATLPAPEAHMDLLLYLLSSGSIGVNGQRFDARTWAGPGRTDPGLAGPS